MGHTRNTTPMVEASKSKSVNKRAWVLSVIHQMEKNNERINFSRVMKQAKVAKSFLHKYDDIKLLIMGHNNEPYNPDAISESQKEIDALKKRISDLEKESRNYQKDELLRGRYEKLLEENKGLKKQLEVAYLKYQ